MRAPSTLTQIELWPSKLLPGESPSSAASPDVSAAIPGALNALRLAVCGASPLVVEHDWDGTFAYGAPRIFAFLWPHSTHVTLGLLHGARLRPSTTRLVGRGPAMRTVAIRDAREVDGELRGLLGRAAERAVRDGLLR